MGNTFKIILVILGFSLMSLTGIAGAKTPSFQSLGAPVGSDFSGAFGVSNDGSAVVGYSIFESSDRDAFR